MNRKGILCLILCMLLALPFGCGGDNRPGTESWDPDTDEVTIVGNGDAYRTENLPHFNATPAPETQGVSELPAREPKADDVSKESFPHYDTGWDADYAYQSDELRIAIKKCVFPDDGQTFYIADIRMRSLDCFRMGFANGKFNSGREDPEAFAMRDNVIFGVSGSFNKGLVIHNGEQVKGLAKDLINYTSGIAVVYRDGSVNVFNLAKNERFDYEKENAQHGGVLHALQFGPVLVQNGTIPDGLKKNGRHPRIMFGYYEPGHYAAVAVDGRSKNAIGMTEIEMAQLMQALGCVHAINLDGGTSAVMLFMGKTINVPSGVDRDGDGVAGRDIVDMLEFAEFDAAGAAPALSSIPADRIRGK